MTKSLDIDDRERDVIYIDAREFNKNKSGYDRGTGVLEYINYFKTTNRKFARDFKNYTKDNIVTNKNIPIGDYLHNDVCIEVKEYRTGDLQDSIRGRRLATQSHELFKLRDSELYAHPLRDCRILVMTDGDGFEHIKNSPDIYKGLLNFGGETPVDYVNYTNNYTNGNPYEHLGDSIMHLFGMNGSQIGRQSHVSMIKTTNSAITSLLSLDTLNSSECKKLCDDMGWNAWHQTSELLVKPGTDEVDCQYGFKILLNYTTQRKAIKTLCKMTGQSTSKMKFELNLL